jgi:phosphatidylglycerophosphate synthase
MPTTQPAVAEGYRDTLRRLSSAQKSAARSAPAYSRFVNRKLGRFLAAWAYRAGLTPNQVTGISAAFTFTGIGLLAVLPQTWWTGVAVALALVVGYAFDSADGQVARLRGGGSPAGEWLDHVVDSVKVAALPLAVLVSFARAESMPEAWLLVPLLGTVASAVYFFAMILTEQLRRQRGVVSRASADPRKSLVRSLLVIPTDYGLLCLSFLLLGLPQAFAVVFTAIMAATALFTVLAAVKWFREINALAPASA